jgi:hypothetical protein
MGKSYADPFTRANGPLGSIPSGPVWNVLSGSVAISSNRALFSTAPGSNPLAVVDVGLRSNGQGNFDVAAKPNHYQGNALYVRVLDASNWVRARLNYRQVSYQYYNDGYWYKDYRWQYGFQPKKLQRVVETRTYSAWSTGWPDTGVKTGCRLDSNGAPATQAPVVDDWGNNIKEFRWWAMSDANSGCDATHTMYKEEYRDRTSSSSFRWVDDGYVCGSNERFTTGSGSTQIVDNGPVYYNYTNTANGPYDVLVSTTAVWPGQLYVSPTYPDANNNYPGSDPPDPYDSTAYGYYGPYTGYNYYTDVVLEKCVAGTITNLGTASGQASSSLRLRAVGSSLQVFINGSGTALLSATDSTHLGQSKIGIGGGASDYSPANPDWDDFSVTILHAELVMIGGAWVSGTGWKVHNGSGWVDYETKVK